MEVSGGLRELFWRMWLGSVDWGCMPPGPGVENLEVPAEEAREGR